MKKQIILTSIIANCLTCSFSQGIELEKWTYDGYFTGLLSDVPSETGTQSRFGSTSTPFLRVSSDAGLIIAIPVPNREYSGGVSSPSYAGKDSGLCQISYNITNSRLTNTNTVHGKFGWGLRYGSSDCDVFVQYTNNTFRLIINDKNGTMEAALPITGTQVQDLQVRQLYDLDASGNAGSFRVYYSIGMSSEVEVFQNQLTLHDNFQIDELRMNVFANGFGDYDFISFDNLVLEEPSQEITLAFIDKSISFIEDNGKLPGNTYEPNDKIQIVTVNLNDSIVSVSNVTTSLYADPSAFSITPKSIQFPSLAPKEAYTATYQVEILEGAVDGSNNVFTVTNRIDSPSLPAPLIFTDTIK